MKLTPYSERRIAYGMFYRGKHFMLSSVLLSKAGGSRFVVLHLLCQGIELVMKSLLLLNDYHKYRPQILKMSHNLETCTKVVIAVSGLKPLSKNVARELSTLNELYRHHRLRYENLMDILGGIESIEFDLVAYKGLAMIRLGERLFREAAKDDK